jgi:metal-responsive CopG/Arc/MetJ family transcriptional regulator
MKTAQYTKSLTVSLRPEIFEKIKRITDEKQISLGEWVRDAVDAVLEKHQPKEDQMNDQFRNRTIIS